MIWMTWRQHRSEALIVGLVVAAFAAIVLATGLPAYAAFTDRGLDACHGRPTTGDRCSPLVAAFQNEFGHPNSPFVDLFLWSLPALFGMFIGAPLLAREFEHGTWQLAWGQAVPRQRWVVVKLTLLLAAAVIVAAAVSGLFMWWREPHVSFDGRLGANYFSYALPVFVAYTVFAITLGATAGRLTRRTLPAMAVVLLVFIGVRVPFEIVVRHQLQEPLITYTPFGESYVSADQNLDLVVSRQVVDRNGNPVADSVLLEAESRNGPNDASGLEALVQEMGLREEVKYHPASSFWRFQFIEAGIFLTMSAALVGALFWLVHRSAL